MWQVVFLFAAVFAVQAFLDDDPKFDSSFDSFDINNLQQLMSAFGSLTSYAIYNREKNLAHLRNTLSSNDFQTVMHGVMTLDRANETLQEAFPALRQSLYTLTDALPAFTSIISHNREAKPNRHGTLPKEVQERLFQLFPVLNEALGQFIPAFPIVTDTLIMLVKELPRFFTAIPALSRSFASKNAAVRSQLALTLPAYGRACDSLNDNVSKFNEYALPYLVPFLSSVYRYTKTSGMFSSFHHNRPMYNPRYSTNQYFPTNFEEDEQCPHQNSLY